METLFRRQYMSNWRQKMTPTELVNTKKEKEESLKAFMKRYNEITQRVKDVNHIFIINNLPSCLRPGYFTEKLYVRPPKTMDELQERVTRYIRIEDMRSSRTRKEGKRLFDDNDKNGEPPQRDFPRTPKFNHYTPLNAPRAKILEEALSAELLTLRRAHTPKKINERKSCYLHKNYGHTIEECIMLKNEIERLIQAGRLRKYV
ncbi:hypothetical protein V8G54_032190 [Vigna mungo]|uniref:Retrotransposon gag domain-containing protein n=1 Tax=Vigna mungo TaxID=3915 RepID=A0AAQ3RHM2_VIGMU